MIGQGTRALACKDAGSPYRQCGDVPQPRREIGGEAGTGR